MVGNSRPKICKPMLAKRPDDLPAKALLLAALGDATRLSLVARLGNGEQCSISVLTQGGQISRQAVTKHLRVLQRARIVRQRWVGRESLFQLDPRPIHELSVFLDSVSRQWDA